MKLMNRIKIVGLSLLMSVVIFLFFTGSALGAERFMPGNVNGDEKLDMADAVLALQMLNLTNPAGQTINSDADVNHDGIIGREEALFALQKLAGLRPSFLYESPVILSSPETTSVNPYAFSGSVSPEVVSLRYSLNGGPDEPLDIVSGSFGGVLTLNAGPNSLCAKAADSTGSISESCFTVVFDPIMGVLPFSQTKNYTLSGMIYPSMPAVTSLRYSLNGGPYQNVTLMGAGGVSYFMAMGLQLNAGENAVCLRSADAAGNTISSPCYTVVWVPVGVTSDDTSPASSYTLTGQASPEVASLTYSLNDGAVQNVSVDDEGNFTIPLILAPRTNAICLKGTGATGSVLSEFCYAVAYLPVTITSPYHVAANAYHLTGIATADVTALSCSLNGGTTQPIAFPGGVFSHSLTLNPGVNSVCTTAEAAGISGTSCFAVVYDTGAPSSFTLIDNARAAGSITVEEALIYKAYAASQDALTDSAGLQAEIYAAAPTLSQAARDILGGFLAPPYYEAVQPVTGQSSSGGSTRQPMDINTHCSIFEDNPSCKLSEDWSTVDGTFVKVWYLKKNEAMDRPVAQRILEMMETKERVWHRLTTAMGRLPLTDDHVSLNGGDGRLDICLVEQLSMDGLTIGIGGKKAVPVYIMINRYNDLARTLPATVHEFMHAIQFAINVKGSAISGKEYLTLSESTANWASNYIFGATVIPSVYNQWEHKFIGSYLGRTDKAYDYAGTMWFPYGLYPFALYLSKMYGNAVIKQIWDLTPQYDQRYAIDQALNRYRSQFKQAWPEYARMLWNQGSALKPTANFKTWDNIQAGPHKGGALIPPGNSLETYDVMVNNRQDLDVDLPSFSIRYFHFNFDDPNARAVLFMNGLNFKLAEAKAKTSRGAEVDTYSATRIDDWTLTKGAKVQALIKKGGQWQAAEDWSSYPFKPFCRDIKDERIEELVLVVSVGDLSGKPFAPLGLKPALWVSDVPCGPGKFTAGISCNNGVDTKNMTVSAMDYAPGGWLEARGDRTDNKTTYAPIERTYAFSGGSVDWSAKTDDAAGSGSTPGSEAAGLGLKNITFVRSSSNGYKAYDFAGKIGNLVYEFQKDCPSNYDPPSLTCYVAPAFYLKPAFDREKKKYTRQVSVPHIDPNGPGSDFSEENMSYPEALSAKSRVPMDGGEECFCPGAGSPEPYTCSGSFSLQSTPEL
jgi:hypothetical protein